MAAIPAGYAVEAPSENIGGVRPRISSTLAPNAAASADGQMRAVAVRAEIDNVAELAVGLDMANRRRTRPPWRAGSRQRRPLGAAGRRERVVHIAIFTTARYIDDAGCRTGTSRCISGARDGQHWFSPARYIRCSRHPSVPRRAEPPCPDAAVPRLRARGVGGHQWTGSKRCPPACCSVDRFLGRREQIY